MCVTVTVSFTCALSTHHHHKGARAPTTPQLAPTAARKAGASRVVPASENRRPYTTAGQAAPGGPSGEGSAATTRENAHVAPPAGGGYDAACSLVERASGKKEGKTHAGVLPQPGRQDRGRAPGPPGRLTTKPGCRVRPAADHGKRRGARGSRAVPGTERPGRRRGGALAPGYQPQAVVDGEGPLAGRCRQGERVEEEQEGHEREAEETREARAVACRRVTAQPPPRPPHHARRAHARRARRTWRRTSRSRFLLLVP